MSSTQFTRRVPARYLWLAVIAGLMAVLVACSGGGSASVGSGGTGAAFGGPISGFGSIIVNGVRIDNSTATITLDDDNISGRDADLKLGMMVEVEGDRDANGITGKATNISTRSFLQGQISGTPASNQFMVLRTTVTVTPGTVYGGGATGFGSLAANDYVEIHGIRDASGGVRATRVEKIAATPAATPEVRLTGTVQSATGSAFVINGITVQYQSANLVNMPNGVSAGMLVRVKGTLSDPITIVASKVRQVRLTPEVKERQQFELKGFVTKFTSATDFEVNGLPVNVPTTAKVEGTIALGSRVEVEGSIANSILVASKVETEDDSQEKQDAFEMHGMIADLDSIGKTFTMRNGTVKVRWDNTTRFDSSLPNSDASLTNGLRVEVKGMITGDVLIVTQIKLDN